MNVKDILKNPIIETPKVPGFLLRQITGWAFVAASVGVFMDAMLSRNSEGSIGLIPLYLGFVIGSICFVIYMHMVAGWIPALLAVFGLVGMWYFMGSYPDGAEGWIGAVLIGIAHLFLPLSGRFASVFWVATGVLGFPEFHARPWGQISAFTLFGVATAVTGLFILWGLSSGETIDDKTLTTNA